MNAVDHGGSFFRVLGIDPGSRVAGFACLSATKARPILPRDFVLIGAGALRTRSEHSITERIGYLHQAVHDLLEEFKPDYCVIEKAFCGNNANSALRLGEVRGAMIASMRRHDIQVAELTPAEVKRVIAGNGRATKGEVQSAVISLMQLTPKKMLFDVSDAIAIALSFGLTSFLEPPRGKANSGTITL